MSLSNGRPMSVRLRYEGYVTFLPPSPEAHRRRNRNGSMCSDVRANVVPPMFPEIDMDAVPMDLKLQWATEDIENAAAPYNDAEAMFKVRRYEWE